ncbi:MAG TPA: potassium channel family protein [Candidatus Paceibacterota bacterium]
MKKLFLLIANDLRIIIAIYVASLLLAAFLFHMFEGKTFFEGFWWACVTAPTVGFGDFSPATVGGRVMGITFMHFWTFIILPMIIGNVVMRLLSDKQKFTHEEQEWQEQALIALAKRQGVELPPPPRDF